MKYINYDYYMIPMTMKKKSIKSENKINGCLKKIGRK